MVKKGKQAEEGVSEKVAKAAKKAERKAVEAARKAEVAKMMAMEMSEDEEVSPIVDKDLTSVDRFGNTVLASKKADAELQAERAAARKRREAKLVVVENQQDVVEKKEIDQETKEIKNIKAKVSTGQKLSNKERKLLKKAQSRAEREEETRKIAADPLAQFSLSLMERIEVDENTHQKQIRLNGVSITAPSKRLLTDAEIKFTCGHRYGLLAPNGTGKSTLLKFLVSGKLPHSMDALLVDQESTNIDENRSVLEQVLAADAMYLTLRQRLMYAETALETAANDESIDQARREIIACCDELESSGAAGHEARARSILAGLGFDDKAVESPGSFLSGGWRMRLNLAKALFVRPTLCCLDEPSNHLDLEAVIWLFDFLVSKDWRQDGILIVCSHDQELLEEVCTDYCLIQDETLEYHRSGLSQLRSGREVRRRKAVRDHEKHIKAINEERKKHPNASLEKIHDKVKQRLNVSRLLIDRPREYAVHFDFGNFADENLANVGGISLRGVSFNYDNNCNTTKKNIASFTGFQDLDFDLSPATRSAICGANGTGKSTLLKLLSGQLIPTHGDRLASTKCRLGVYDQHFSLLADCGRSTATKLLMDRYNVQEHTARATLGKFGLDGPRHLVPIPELSGGQKARLVFAALSLMRPHILLLDEPSNHLDLESLEALIQGILTFKGGVLAVSHDPALVDALSRDPDTGVEQPLYICERGVEEEDIASPSQIRIEQGGFPAYRRRLQRESIERQARLAKEAAERLASARLLRGPSGGLQTSPRPSCIKAEEETAAQVSNQEEKKSVASVFGGRQKKNKKTSPLL